MTKNLWPAFAIFGGFGLVVAVLFTIQLRRDLSTADRIVDTIIEAPQALSPVDSAQGWWKEGMSSGDPDEPGPPLRAGGPMERSPWEAKMDIAPLPEVKAPRGMWEENPSQKKWVGLLAGLLILAGLLNVRYWMR